MPRWRGAGQRRICYRRSLQHPLLADTFAVIVVSGTLAGKPARGKTVALKPDPTAPFHSVQYALRVLETVVKHTGGVTETQVARETGLPAAHLAHLLTMLRHEDYVERTHDGAYVTGDALVLLGAGGDRQRALQLKL